ncbi:MAG: hypothetical protein GY953_23865, partial [bacterium]|nr:hypothetical protein [bacterium]
MFIRIAELAGHIAHHRPANPEAPSLLVDFLAGRSQEMEWELDKDFFRQRMKDGTALVLLDGLDEAPGEETRKTISSLLEKAARTYGKCKFVVTSRPGAYTGEVVLPGFDHARIAELDPEAIARFLERWSEAIWTESPNQARRHHRELLKEVSAPQIRRMARNPVMLTALAVVHWHEKRLP